LFENIRPRLRLFFTKARQGNAGLDRTSSPIEDKGFFGFLKNKAWSWQD
jgi:hypothetical protein